MSREDRDRWERRYTESAGETSELVEDFFIEVVERLPEHGAALDVAGGTGRHALWLARRGLDVTLVDIAPSALDRAQALAVARGLRIRTAELDLDRDPLPSGPFRMIVCTFFLPSEDQWTAFVERLEVDGFLLVVLPTRTNLERHPRPGPHFLLPTGVIPALFGRLGLSMVRSEIGWERRGRHLFRALATKRSTDLSV